MSCDTVAPNLALLAALRAAAGDRPFTMTSEWLGYLPYGQYVWIEVNGVDISSTLPSPWDTDDVRGLVESRLVEQLEHHITSDDGLDTLTILRVR